MFSTAVTPFLSLFCREYFKEQRYSASGRNARALNLLSAQSTQGRLLCTQHLAKAFISYRNTGLPCPVEESFYHKGSTSPHESRPPHKQGHVSHAIARRPEGASVSFLRFPPSTHPKLGVQSRHKGFHRYALQRIFRPFLENGSSD